MADETVMDPAEALRRYERRLARERAARLEAEAIAERATRQLYETVQDLTRSYIRTLEAWTDNIRTHRDAIERLAPGFAAVLQGYMTVARLSFARRTALEYMILAVKGRPADGVGLPGLP